MTKRKIYTAAFKAKAVLEPSREGEPLAQVAAGTNCIPANCNARSRPRSTNTGAPLGFVRSTGSREIYSWFNLASTLGASMKYSIKTG